MFVVYGARIVKLYLTTTLIAYLLLFIESESQKKPPCLRGKPNRVTGICTCPRGWYGERCQYSNCRQRLTAGNGTITNIEGLSKCLWILKADRPKSVLELTVELFSSSKQSQCTKFILYVYNGPSFRAPLLAVFSGVARDNGSATTLRSTSNTVQIYFDNKDSKSRFRIKYSIINNCSLLCNYHGNCNAIGECICDSGWTGSTCNTSICAHPCIHGTCNSLTFQCDCDPGFSGPLCNTSSRFGTWNKHVTIDQEVAQARLGHGAGVVGDCLWVYGGYSFINNPLHNLIRYNFSRNAWEVVSFSNSKNPGNRYGHSLAVYKNDLIVFGGISNGMTVRDLWSFNVANRQWTRVQLSKDINPIAVSGHTATLVNKKMVILFGYGPLFGFTPYIQVYDIVTNKWKIINCTLKEPTFGHTSQYDPITKLIYVHGGRLKGGYSNALHSYNPGKNHWTLLSKSQSVHVLHSSVLIGNMFIVYGGYTFLGRVAHSRCYDTDFMVYDIICDKWSVLPQTNLPPLSGRFGHTAVEYKSKMYIFGGFNGIMKNDLLSYSLGNCSSRTDNVSCLSVNSVSGCFWEPNTKSCLGPEKRSLNVQDLPSSCTEPCNMKSFCGGCKALGAGCQWCNGKCMEKSQKCVSASSEICLFKTTVDNHNPVCEGPACYNILPNKDRNSCESCTKSLSKDTKSRTYNPVYMWCNNQKKCIDRDSYSALLPNGQCNDWVSTQSQCKDIKCAEHMSCDACLSNPACGWCDDNSGTGVGHCIEGGAERPYSPMYLVGKKTCPKWYFTDCPVCQCNGHSICLDGKTCTHCKHHTSGRLCQYCKTGFYGDSRNGGTCVECKCNGHAKNCNHRTSKCVCLTKGIKGDRCEICDEGYEGNATNGKMTCYYKLKIGTKKVFNVSGKTGVNMQFTPLFNERDLFFNIEVISSEKKAKMNITYVKQETSTSKEKSYSTGNVLGRFQRKFSHREFSFHKGPITFRAYVYDIKPDDHIRIMVNFNQTSTLNINLLEFFLTFFGCFLSLLFLASIGWRIRSRYHSYLQRRAERDRMANRPFATVHLLLPNELEVISKSSPSLIAVEPLSKNKVAIATVVVLLPYGEEGAPPVGQCGVCFGSMIMSHAGHQHLCLRSRMGRKKTKKHSTMTTYHL